MRALTYTFMNSLISCLGGLLFGLVTAIVAGAGPLIMVDFNLSGFELSLVVSILLLGASAAAFFSSGLSHRFGRKRTLMFSALLYLMGSLGTALSHGYYELVLFRAVLGFALGISSYTVPMYIAEIAPKEHRGKFVIFNSMAITGGIVVAYGVNLLFLNTPVGWRWMLGASSLPAGVFLLGVMVLPESPRWLAMKDLGKAKRILTQLRGSSSVDAELNDMTSLTSTTMSFTQLFKVPNRKLVMMGVSLAVMQQITGINTIFYYTPILFEEAGFHGVALTWIPFWAGGMNFAMTGLALWMVDKFGRRPLLLSGFLGMALSLMTMAGCLALEGSTLRNLTLILACLSYIGCFAMSIGCLFWLLISEVYPTHLKSRAMGIITATNWFTNFAVCLTFLPMMELIGLKLTFSFYAFACIMSLVLAHKMVPETKSVTLESIQSNLLAGKKLRDLGAPL